MSIGSAAIRTLATSRTETLPPAGVSISRLRTLSRLCHAAVQSGRAVNGLADAPERLVVVRAPRDPDPDLARVRRDEPIRAHRTAHVRVHAADPRDHTQLRGGSPRDAVHLGKGGARRSLPAHQDVAIPERWPVGLL